MVYITGDTHGTHDFAKLTDFPGRERLTKQDIVIIAGDFGGLWYGTDADEPRLDAFDFEPYTVAFVDGNHENFHALSWYRTEEWNGGKVHRIREHVIHLMRGQIYGIQGSTFFTFGGGTSLDREYRVPGFTWWPEEIPSAAERKEALDNLAAHGNKVDYIITHTCPRSVKKQSLSRLQPIIQAECPVENFLDKVLRQVTFERWYFGHYHIDADIERYHMSALYQNVVRCI